MRILLVEDHSMMRFGTRAYLEFVAGMKVVGEAESGEEAIRLIGETKPDLLLLDLELKGKRNGLELCREIKAMSDAPKVLIHTAFNSGGEIQAARESGADGFMHKGVGHEKLPQAIKDVCSGKRVWEPGEEQTAKLRTKSPADEESLTPREKEIAVFVVGRYTNSEIAEELSISVGTVKTHVGHVLHKLELSNRRALIRKFTSPE